MTSVERIVEYCNVECENVKEKKIEPPANWPYEGKIVFDNVSYSYGDNLPKVLKNVSLTINGKEKIGIVGRCLL
jgi:ABC-type multidrug transport system fused ATPase/permease subunit